MEEKKTTGLETACHILGLVGFLGPLIIWLLKKDESPSVDTNGKESLNFQISMLIYTIIAGISTVILIGIVLMPAVAIFNVVMVITAAVKVNKGEEFRYPLCLRFIK